MMKKRTLVLAAIAAITALPILTGCKDDETKATTPNPTPTTTPEPQTVEVLNPGTVQYEGSGIADSSGAVIDATDAIITVPAEAVYNPITVNVTEVELPLELPDGLIQLGDLIDVGVSEVDQESMNAPLKITLRYDDTGIEDESSILPLHFNGDSYEPVRLNSQDFDANLITFESRDLSPFVLTLAKAVAIELETGVVSDFKTDFDPDINGWQIENFASYFSNEGNCLGMSAYATWFYNHREDTLYNKFDDEIATYTATRAHLAQNQLWGKLEWEADQLLGEHHLAKAMKLYLNTAKQPLILTMGIEDTMKHASVLTGYDETGFYFYDVNHPGQTQHISYNQEQGFGTYGNYNSFGYVARASLGRTEDFGDLTTEAENGFTTSTVITLNSPTDETQVYTRETTLSGSVSGDLNANATMLAFVKGISRSVPITNGTFNPSIEVSSGTNTLILLAGVDITNQAYKQSNWYKNSGILVRNFEGVLADSRLSVTLGWDQDNSDVDLNVTEPQGESIYFANYNTSSGLELDFDNVYGFGPEHGTLVNSPDVIVQDGEYLIRAHYFNGPDEVDVTGKVTVVINEGAETQKMKELKFCLNDSEPYNSYPSDSGADWADIARVDVVSGEFTWTNEEVIDPRCSN